ncbi:MAG: glutamyl-tRNA reductase [Porphyromonas sp.]|nr:glutamyl-tRNA reductase [Porphyromonas sp.]
MITVIGINYKTASVEVREAFSFTPAEVADFLKRLQGEKLIQGGFLLSTCNRTELVCIPCEREEGIIHRIISEILDYKQQPLETSRYFFHLIEERAMLHVFSMASGLKSMVRGETQILGQLKEAVNISRSGNLLPSVLVRLVDKTLEVAKKIRSSYSISHAQSSAGAAAVNMISRKYGEDISSGKTLVLGAGQMADTVVRALKTLGVKDIHIYNRTAERASRFANKHEIMQYYHSDQLYPALQDTRWLWVATAASSPIINASIIGETHIEDQPLVIFDLAVPRNVEIDVLGLSNVRLYGIDDLREGSPEEVDERFPSNVAVKELLMEAVEEFKLWRDGLALRDVYGHIRSEMEMYLEGELKYLVNVDSPEVRSIIEKHLTHLSTTISSSIISKVRRISEETEDARYAEALLKILQTP